MTQAEILHLIEDLPRRIRVVLTNLLTWLVALQTLITVLVTQGELLNLHPVVEYGSIALTAIGAVVVFIRRVTPVADVERGLL